MEGANVAQDHINTEFYDHFGTNYDGAGSQNAIYTLSGVEQTFSRNSEFSYPTGDPNYSIDQISGGDGETFLTSQDGLGRGVYYDSGLWRAINVAPILGAYSQDEQFSTRKFMMMEYISFLANIQGPELVLSEYELDYISFSPGEAVTQIITVYNAGFIDLEIWEFEQEGDDAFLIDTMTPITIAGQESSEIAITFRSFEMGAFSGTISLISNDIEHENEVITLTGECLIPADVDVCCDPIEIIIDVNWQQEMSLIVNNIGTGELEYHFWSDMSIEWLSINPESGVIPAGDNVEVIFSFDSSDLLEGEYSTEIILATNDPAEEFIFITVNMTVFTVDNDPAGLPQVTGIQSVFPNPFNPQTCFKYALSEPANVKLDIYNIKGQLVKELVNEYQSGGNYSLIWQADKAVSGVYFYRFQAGNEYQTGKLILLK